ncbi:MAG: TraB/GumN family protein [Treponema sp.]|jgi:pheromone shutdown-related protein TraB|nr:TraB/GumN family protein [Treponema sp.]
MNDNCVRLNLAGREITLVGTAHVSRESIEEVRRVIREEKPGRVCVELDQARYGSISQKENWEKLDVIKILREGKGFLLIANLVLSGFQRRLGDELGVKPGEEMKTAVETAEEMGIPFDFCDRDVQITLRRAWMRCGLLNKCKLLASLLSGAFSTEKLSSEEVESLKKASELDGMMAELSGYLPPVKTTLIDERDRYLAAKIWQSSASANRIAAVVGAGHLQGLRSHLEKISRGEENADVEELNAVPPRSFLSGVIGWIFPLIIVLLIAAGFFRAGTDVSLAMLLRWVLLNGSLAALGTVVALGHPLSVLVSFVGAPLASVNAVIGGGLVSVLIRPPASSQNPGLYPIL